MGTPTPDAKRLKLMAGQTPSSASLSSLQRAGEGGPDVLEFFAQRGVRLKELERQLAEMQRRHEALEKALQRKEKEVAGLQASMATAKANREAEASSHTHECGILEAKLREEYNHNAALTARVAQLEAEKAEADAALRLSATAASTRKHHTEMSAESYSAQLRQLRRELQQAQADAADAAAKERAARAEAEARAANEDAYQAELVAQLEAAQRRVEEERALRKAADTRATEAEHAALLAPASTSSTAKQEQEVVIRTLRAELREMESEVLAARKLREHVRNVEMLRVDFESARASAVRAEGRAADAEARGARASALEAELERWRAALGGGSDATPEQLLHSMARLRREAAAERAAAGTREAELRAARAELDTARRRADEAEAESAQLRGTKEGLELDLLRAQQAAELAGRERDGLRRLVDAYRADEAGEGGGEGVLRAVREQAAVAEGVAEALRTQVAQLEASLVEKTAAAEASATAVAAAAARERDATAAVRAAEADAAALGREVAVLQARVGRGEYNPETMKVLHLIRNPEAQARREAADAVVRELKAEVAALQEQLGLVEGQHGGGGGVAAAKVAMMEKKLVDAEKRHKRLAEVFKAQITNFREAVCFIFGYRVDMSAESTAGLAGTTVRLVAVDDASAELCFKFKRDGSLAVLPTSYVRQRLLREVDLYVTRAGCVPALTANLTLDLFNRRS